MIQGQKRVKRRKSDGLVRSLRRLFQRLEVMVEFSLIVHHFIIVFEILKNLI